MISRNKQQGFTLIEMVTVIAILAIVGVGVTNFLGSGAQIFADVTERTQLISESRFVTERLNREIRGALPNSVRIAGNGNTRHCIEFMPVKWSSFYFDAPVVPEEFAEIEAVEWGSLSPYTYAAGDNIIIYPTATVDIYSDTGKKHEIEEISPIGPGVTELEFDDDVQFATDSPSSRFYVFSTPVSYCVEAGQIRRYENYGLQQIQPVNLVGGALMAENLTNTLSNDAGTGIEDPFRLNEASLTRTASVLMLLEFARDNEIIVFNNEVHIPNVP